MTDYYICMIVLLYLYDCIIYLYDCIIISVWLYYYICMTFWIFVVISIGPPGPFRIEIECIEVTHWTSLRICVRLSIVFHCSEQARKYLHNPLLGESAAEHAGSKFVHHFMFQLVIVQLVCVNDLRCFKIISLFDLEALPLTPTIDLCLYYVPAGNSIIITICTR